jgi:hypothetical protein
VIYISSIFALANLTDEAWSKASLFQPDFNYPPLVRFLIQPLLVATSGLIVFLFPAFFFLLPYRQRFKSGLEFILVVFPINIVILALAVSLYKAVAAQSLTRTSFFLISVFLTAVAILYAQVFGKRRSVGPVIESHLRIRLLIGLLLIVALLFIFKDKVFLEDFNGDGVESFQVMRSLKTHLLPYWDFEINGKRGTYVGNPSLVDPLPPLFLTLLLGETAGAARFAFFIYLLCIYRSFLAIANFREEAGGRKSARGANFFVILPIGLFLVLFTLIMSFRAGWHPIFTDILGTLRVVLFTLFLNCTIYFLLTRRSVLFVFFAFLMCLVLYTGPLFLLFLLIFYPLVFKEKRRWLLKPAVWLISLGCLVVLLYFIHGWRAGYLREWRMVLNREYFYGYLAGDVNFRGNLQFLSKCFVYFGGIVLLLAIVLFARFKERARVSIWLALVTILYLAVIFGKEIKAWHYITPIAAVPLIVFLRMNSLLRRRTIAGVLTGLTTCSLLVIVIILWPWKYSVHTDYRKLGERSCMLFSRRQDAVEAARLILDEETIKKGLSEHVWVEYARVSPGPQPGYDYYLTSRRKAPLTGLRLLVPVRGKAYLYGREKEGE